MLTIGTHDRPAIAYEQRPRCRTVVSSLLAPLTGAEKGSGSLIAGPASRSRPSAHWPEKKIFKGRAYVRRATRFFFFFFLLCKPGPAALMRVPDSRRIGFRRGKTRAKPRRSSHACLVLEARSTWGEFTCGRTIYFRRCPGTGCFAARAAPQLRIGRQIRTMQNGLHYSLAVSDNRQPSLLPQSSYRGPQRHATRRFELPIAQGAATNRNEAFLCSGSDAQIEKSAWKNKNDDHRSALWAVRVSDGAAATAEDNGRLDDGNAPRPQRARKTYTAPPSVRMTCQPASAELEPRQISMESGTMAHRTAQGSLRDHFGPVLRSCRQRNREKRNYFGTSVQSPARLLGLVLARFFMRFPNVAQAHRGDATNFAQPEWRSVWLACLAFPESLFTVGELAAVCAFWCS